MRQGTRKLERREEGACKLSWDLVAGGAILFAGAFVLAASTDLPFGALGLRAVPACCREKP